MFCMVYFCYSRFVVEGLILTCGVCVISYLCLCVDIS